MSERTWQDAEEQFESWWWRKTSFCFKFHDTRAAMASARTTKVITTSHPSDFLVTDNGVMFYAEVKSSLDPVKFPFSNIKLSQWSAAKQQEAAGGMYFFFLYSHKLSQWFKLPSSVLIAVKDSGRCSIKWSEIEAFRYIPTP